MPARTRALPVTPPRPYLWAQHTTATSTGAEKKPKSLPPAKPHIPPPRPGTGEGAPRRRRDPQPGLLLLLPPPRWPRAEEGAGGGAGGGGAAGGRGRGEGRASRGGTALPELPPAPAAAERTWSPAGSLPPSQLLWAPATGRRGQRRRGKRSLPPGPDPRPLRRRPEPLTAGLRAAGPGKPPPHLRGSEPRIRRAQQSQVASRRARSPQHMAPLLRPNLSPAVTANSNGKAGIPALAPTHGLSRPTHQPAPSMAAQLIIYAT